MTASAAVVRIVRIAVFLMKVAPPITAATWAVKA
jgi:hypothetical protein